MSRAVRSISRAALLLAVASGCMPPPVKTVDLWLKAFADDDQSGMLEQTVHRDRPLLQRALQALETTPTSTLALAIPPRPVAHEIVEIAERSSGRQVIETRMTVRNPIRSSSKRVGQALPNVPATRTLRRRFLVVEEDETWGVQLDLERVMKRARFASELLRLVAEGRLAEAESRLAEGAPAVPDNGHPGRGDRLVNEIQRRIAERRAGRRGSPRRTTPSDRAQPSP